MGQKRIIPQKIKQYTGVWVIKKNGDKNNEEYLEIIKGLIKKGFSSGGIIDENNSRNNYYFNDKKYIYLSDLKSFDFKKNNKIKSDIYNHNKKISVEFSFFSSFFDKRWESMPYPPSLLYLAGKTSKRGIKSSMSIIDMEAKDYKIPETDFWGFTLFDDLFPELSEFLKSISGKYKGKIAVGGPFPTLSPLAIIAHFPEINFFIRGEADNIISKILKFISAIGKNNIITIFDEVKKYKGFFYHDDNYFIISNLDKVNRLDNIDDLEIDFGLIPDKILEKGLELNLSRGCPRSCIFCSHVHGKNFRMISDKKLENILENFNMEIKKRGIKGKHLYHININDDDILLAKEKILPILKTIKRKGFKIYGFQTSISSFTEKNRVNYKMIDYISDRELYVSKPLLWIGTDTFIEKRGKRLGKTYLSTPIFESILDEFEKKGVLNYHYWIILDGDSNWKEFLEEFFYLWKISKKYKFFFILPTSSYLIPYPYSAAYNKDLKRKESRIIYKTILKSKTGNYDYPFVKKEIPDDLFLSDAVSPEREFKTIGYIKEKKFFDAFQRIYTYLKKSDYYINMGEKERYEFISNIEEKVSELTKD